MAGQNHAERYSRSNAPSMILSFPLWLWLCRFASWPLCSAMSGHHLVLRRFSEAPLTRPEATLFPHRMRGEGRVRGVLSSLDPRLWLRRQPRCVSAFRSVWLWLRLCRAASWRLGVNCRFGVQFYPVAAEASSRSRFVLMQDNYSAECSFSGLSGGNYPCLSRWHCDC